jgi:hypothetical protein
VTVPLQGAYGPCGEAASVHDAGVQLHLPQHIGQAAQPYAVIVCVELDQTSRFFDGIEGSATMG